MLSKALLKEILLENEKFIDREIGFIVPRENIKVPERVGKVCIFYGVRRSGKTYLLFDLFKRHTGRALYLDFEDERLEDFEAGHFQLLEESFYELKPHLIGQKGVVFLLDEVQRVKGWERFARRATERGSLRVFVTGSSSEIMPRQIHTVLRGRSWSLEIFPFSFREYATAKKIPLHEKEWFYTSKKAIVQNAFRDYLRWGGFPEVSFLKTEYEKRKVLKEYLDAMFFRDLVERFKITNISLVERLYDKLFSSFSLKYSLTSFWKQYRDQLAFSKDSLFSYYRYFLESMLIFEARVLAESSYRRLRNPPKIYLVDTGASKRVGSSDWGRLLENAVYLGLRRRGEEVFYFEKEGECDFVAKQERGWAAYQVTWQLDEDTREREIGGLVEACQALGLQAGTILTGDQEGEIARKNKKIHVRPVWKWLSGAS